MKEEKIKVVGKIVKVEVNGFHVEYELGENVQSVFCHKGGKLKKFNIALVVGDSVEVAIGAYDTSKGIITRRLS